MVNLNGHEDGNGGYSQEEPKITTPLLYSTQKSRLVCYSLEIKVDLTDKERVKLALLHKDTDRVHMAFGFGFTPEAQKMCEEYLQNNGMTLETVKNKFCDIIGICPDYIGPEFERFPDGSSKDIWGIVRKLQSYGTGTYGEFSFYPLKEWTPK